MELMGRMGEREWGEGRGMRARLEEIRGLIGAGGRVHMVGIGGIGMAGLARLLKGRGLAVDGCDEAPGRTAEWLEREGIPVRAGHGAGHWAESGAAWGVYSPAVGEGNEERVEAERRGVRLFRRGEVLAAAAGTGGWRLAAVGGTHGKTTTSAMLTRILREAGKAPSWCVGGELWPDGAPGGTGDGEWLVIEADESDGTLALYEAETGVVTNVEVDHLEHFDGREGLEDCFRRFLGRVRGMRLACGEDEGARRLGKEAGAVLYGFGAGMDWRAEGVERTEGGMRFAVRGPAGERAEVRLPLFGRHNALDALAAVAAAGRCGVGAEEAARALEGYRPPRRRFERVAEGRGICVLGDYAHHPTEIRALMESVRAAGARRVLAVFQPHRYTRTLALGKDFPGAFSGAERVWVLPVYAASEAPLEGGRSGDLLRRFSEAGWGERARGAGSFEEAADAVEAEWREGDWVVLAGAGSIERMGPMLKKRLEAAP